MLCEKGLCKINQIRNHTVIGICPEAGKLKTVTGLGLTCSPFLMFLFCIPSGTVGIILCVRAIGNNKNLNIFIQSASCPERISLVAVDLIECFTDSNSSAFQLNLQKSTLNRPHQILRTKRLQQIFLHFQANRLLRTTEIIVAADNDKAAVKPGIPDPLNQRQTVQTSHSHISYNNVRLYLQSHLQCFEPVIGSS